MVTLAERLAWCEKYLVTREGRPFSIEGREWVRDEFFRPADGWRHWPRNVERLCDVHRARAGEIVEWTETLEDEAERPCVNAGCDGCDVEPVMVVLLNLMRRSGKTVNTAFFILSTIFLEPNQNVIYMAAAGKQTIALFNANFRTPIERNPKLAALCEIRGESIKVIKGPGKGSALHVVETSHASTTGRGLTHVVIDEARDADPRTTTALLPSLLDQNGVTCPQNAGHMRGIPAEGAPRHCRVCGSRLRPWFGRAIVESSSGIEEGTDRDWFKQTLDLQVEAPDPRVHMFSSNEIINPAVSKRSHGMLAKVFGRVPALATYLDVELTNTSQRKGEDFLSNAAVRAIIDPDLANETGSPSRCFAFLDTSTTGDLTTLVFVAEDVRDGAEPWQFIRTARIDMWDPKQQKRKHIDPAVIQAHLDRVVPLFPNLGELLVDTRNMPWAIDLVTECRQSRPGWGKKVKSFNGGREERDLGWAVLEQRALQRTLRLLTDRSNEGKRLVDELLGVRRVTRADGTIEIRDRSRKKRHADAAEGLASCCWRIYQEQIRPRHSLRDLNPKSGLLPPRSRPVRGNAAEAF